MLPLQLLPDGVQPSLLHNCQTWLAATPFLVAIVGAASQSIPQVVDMRHITSTTTSPQPTLDVLKAATLTMQQAGKGQLL
jgi:hypothetical protein